MITCWPSRTDQNDEHSGPTVTSPTPGTIRVINYAPPSRSAPSISVPLFTFSLDSTRSYLTYCNLSHDRSRLHSLSNGQRSWRTPFKFPFRPLPPCRSNVSSFFPSLEDLLQSCLLHYFTNSTSKRLLRTISRPRVTISRQSYILAFRTSLAPDSLFAALSPRHQALHRQLFRQCVRHAPLTLLASHHLGDVIATFCLSTTAASLSLAWDLQQKPLNSPIQKNNSQCPAISWDIVVLPSNVLSNNTQQHR